MIQRRRKQIYSLDAKLYLCDDAYDSLLREVEEILEEEKAEFECMPEGIQDGDRGAESRDAQSHLQRAIKALGEVMDGKKKQKMQELMEEIHENLRAV